MKTLQQITLVILSIFFVQCTNSQTATAVSVSEFETQLKATPNAQLIDVRTPGEFNNGHLDNALNIDWRSDAFEQEVAKLDKNKPVFVYCLSGGRSAKAASKLTEMGFKNVTDMQGGYLQWSATHPNNDTANSGMSMDEYQKLTQSAGTVVIDFYAEWCAPCKKMAPYLAKMEEELKDKVKIVRIDADKHKKLFNQLGYQGLPVVLVFKNGKATWQKNAFVSEEELRAQIQ